MSANLVPSSLVAFEGRELSTAAEAILKGVLEAETEISLIAAPPGDPFQSLRSLGQRDEVAYLLRRHGTRFVPAVDAARAVAMLGPVARAERHALAAISNRQLDTAMSALSRLGAAATNGGLACLFEDYPGACPASSPRAAARRLGWPVLEPSDLTQLRDAIDWSMRLSRAAALPVAIVAHTRLLRSVETLSANPNRVSDSVDEMLSRRKRRRGARPAELGDILRIARRLELNAVDALPSPGEREPLGLIAVGPAVETVRHLGYALELRGRLPVLRLLLVHPLDEAVVGRFLDRCERVVVLEPRPGEVESGVLDVAESMRRRGEHPAAVWGRVLPPRDDGQVERMTSDRDLHPSTMVRKLVHVLHHIRPSIQLASLLAAEPPPLEFALPERGARIGPAVAVEDVRKRLGAVQEWLDEHAEGDDDDEQVTPTTLALDGVAPPDAAPRIVDVLVRTQSRFETESIGAVRQLAWEDRPAVLVICEGGPSPPEDLERLVRGAVPGARADRVRIEMTSLRDEAALDEQLRQAAIHDGLTIVIARDGPPPRYDLGAMERALGEIDKLGFQPTQWTTRPAEQPCEIRADAEAALARVGAETDTTRPEGELTVDRLTRRMARRVYARIRPMVEQILVERTRPPARRELTDGSARLTPPTPEHARVSQWRVHFAGYRGRGPGLAARALCLAGRNMGYAVKCNHTPTIIGPGRRAWAQVLFTRLGRHETQPPLSTSIPYGEADLLIGLDAPEALRAIGPDPMLRVAEAGRAGIVVNTARLSGSPPLTAVAEMDRAALLAAFRRVGRPEWVMCEAFAEACRAGFHTDRVTDLALLGAAFQRGLIPLSLDAIRAAVRQLEHEGFGRSVEAFEFGRRLEVSPGLFVRPRPRDEDAERIARRITLGMRGGRLRRARQRLAALAVDGLRDMPGLTETDRGRRARREFVLALHRCLRWGGPRLADRYADLVMRLYRADRGDTGRALTRDAVLPLAEALLVRDSMYIAAMATSREQRRRVRRLLNVRRARGDRMERRYMTRFELVALRRRVRLQVRTSDWPLRLVSALRHVVPARWRGTRNERAVRRLVESAVEQAASAPSAEYERWSAVMAALHDLAETGRLRGAAPSTLEELIAGGGQGEAESA